MKGIKMSDCKFYVNEAERTVVCVIPGTRNMFESFVVENFNFSDISIDFAITNCLAEKMEMPCSFSGKAVCAEGDEWNEEVGRMIAFSRAKAKFYRSFFKRASMFVNTFDRCVNEMVTIFNNMGDKVDEHQRNLEYMIEQRVNK